MPVNYKQRQEEITFDALRQTVKAEFARIPDHRRAHATSPLPDLLLGQSLRARFKVKVFRSMEALYRQMAELYDIQLC